MWLLAPNHRADFFDALCNLLWRVTLVALTRGDDNHLRGEVVQLAILETPKDILSPVPLDADIDILEDLKHLTAMPKLRQCMRQKLVSQMRELKRFWIRESPTQSISGSASLVSVKNR